MLSDPILLGYYYKHKKWKFSTGEVHNIKPDIHVFVCKTHNNGVSGVPHRGGQLFWAELIYAGQHEAPRNKMLIKSKLLFFISFIRLHDQLNLILMASRAMYELSVDFTFLPKLARPRNILA